MSETLQQFVSKYTGQQVDANGNVPGDAAYAQCVDIVNLYLQEVLGEPEILWTNATDFLNKFNSDFQITLNTPTGVPVPGDVVVFHNDLPLYGVNGHVAIVISADVNSMTVFEQNYPKEGTPCQTGTHTYGGCTGWAHQKNLVVVPADDSLQTVLTHYNVKTAQELITMVDEQLAFLKDARVQITQLNEKYADYDKIKNQLQSVESDTVAFCDNVQQMLLSKDSSFTTLAADIKTMVNKNISLEDAVTKAQKALDDETATYNAKIAEIQSQADTQQKALLDLQAKVTLLTDQNAQLQAKLAGAQTHGETLNIFQQAIESLKKFFERS